MRIVRGFAPCARSAGGSPRRLALPRDRVPLGVAGARARASLEVLGRSGEDRGGPVGGAFAASRISRPGGPLVPLARSRCAPAFWRRDPALAALGAARCWAP